MKLKIITALIVLLSLAGEAAAQSTTCYRLPGGRYVCSSNERPPTTECERMGYNC